MHCFRTRYSVTFSFPQRIRHPCVAYDLRRALLILRSIGERSRINLENLNLFYGDIRPFRVGLAVITYKFEVISLS